MKMRIFAIILVLCAMLPMITACAGDKEPEKTPLTNNEVVRIVLSDLDMEITQVQPHVHTGEYQGNEVYFVYVTVEGVNLAYAIDMYSGEILNIAESNHSH